MYIKELFDLKRKPPSDDNRSEVFFFANALYIGGLF